MPKRDLDHFESVLTRNCSYNDAQKKEWHRVVKLLLKDLRPYLQREYGASDTIRSNKAGIAVSGEVTLHFERLYIQVSQPAGNYMKNGVLYRSCNGLKDYTGGPNNFAQVFDLLNPQHFARTIQTKVAFPINIGEPRIPY